MEYRLIGALASDEEWLERLRRDVYQELFQTTWGGWDEARVPPVTLLDVCRRKPMQASGTGGTGSDSD